MSTLVLGLSIDVFHYSIHLGVVGEGVGLQLVDVIVRQIPDEEFGQNTFQD